MNDAVKKAAEAHTDFCRMTADQAMAMGLRTYLNETIAPNDAEIVGLAGMLEVHFNVWRKTQSGPEKPIKRDDESAAALKAAAKDIRRAIVLGLQQDMK